MHRLSMLKKWFLSVFLFTAVVFMQVPAQASGGIDPADPMVKD